MRVETTIDEDGNVTVSTGGERAVTDSSGVAVLTSMEGKTGTLRVESEGHAPWTLAGIPLPFGESVERIAELTPGGEVLVTVLDPDGEPVAGVQVEHRSSASDPMSRMMGMRGLGGGARRVTDSEGRLRFGQLEAGLHGFRIGGSGPMAMAFGDRMMVSVNGGSGGFDDSWSQVEVQEGGSSELTLHAAARGGLRGRVLEAGKVLTGATVSVRRGSAPGGRMARMMGGGGGREARTDGDGEYELAGLEVGDYTLVVEHPTRSMPAELPLEVRQGDNRFDVDLPVSILEGRVVGSDGKPLAGLKVRAERYREGGGPQMRFAFVVDDGDGPSGGVITGDEMGPSGNTDADGRFQLRGVASEVDLVVVASGAGVQETRSEPLSVGRDETQDGIDLVAEQAGSFVVEVRDAAGEPARFTMVNASWAGEGDVSPEIGFTNDEGVAKLAGLNPGLWRLEARSVGNGPEGPGTEVEAEARPAEEVLVPIRME